MHLEANLSREHPIGTADNQYCSDVPETLKFNSIEQYVQYFTEKLLKFRSDSPNYSLTTLMERAIDYKRKLATSEALDSSLDSIGDSDLAVQIGHALNEHIVHMLEKNSVGAASTDSENDSAPIFLASDSARAASEPSPRHRPSRYIRSTAKKRASPQDRGNNDLVRRKELVNLSVEPKLDLIIQLSEDASKSALRWQQHKSWVELFKAPVRSLMATPNDTWTITVSTSTGNKK